MFIGHVECSCSGCSAIRLELWSRRGTGEEGCSWVERVIELPDSMSLEPL